MKDDYLWNLILDLNNIYRAGMGLRPLKNFPEPEILDGREQDYDCDEDEPDRYQNEDERLDDPRHGQADSINRERYKPERSDDE